MYVHTKCPKIFFIDWNIKFYSSADEGDGGTDQGRRKSKSKKKKKESFSSGAEQETSQTPNMLQVVDKNR